MYEIDCVRVRTARVFGFDSNPSVVSTDNVFEDDLVIVAEVLVDVVDIAADVIVIGAIDAFVPEV